MNQQLHPNFKYLVSYKTKSLGHFKAKFIQLKSLKKFLKSVKNLDVTELITYEIKEDGTLEPLKK